MSRIGSGSLSVPFSAPDTWHGGYYELALELGPRSDERLIAAHRAVWEHPQIAGCYEDWRIEPTEQPRLDPRDDLLLGSLYGIAHLPDGKSLPAGTFIVRESDGPNGEFLSVADGSELLPDWLGFYIPTGTLAAVYPIGSWPFGSDEASRVWREPLNQWLADVGTHVYRRARFRLGLVGFEASGRTYASDLAREGIPEERWMGYLWPEQAQLQWYPANRFSFASPD